VARSAQVACLAVVFSIYVGYFVPLGIHSKPLSLAVLALFTWVNYRGVKLGATFRTALLWLKVWASSSLLRAPSCWAGTRQ
jgi:amino acid transporter